MKYKNNVKLFLVRYSTINKEKEQFVEVKLGLNSKKLFFSYSFADYHLEIY